VFSFDFTQGLGRITHAARRRARGTEWEELYQRFIPDYGKLNAITRGYAEDSSNARDGLKNVVRWSHPRSAQLVAARLLASARNTGRLHRCNASRGSRV